MRIGITLKESIGGVIITQIKQLKILVSSYYREVVNLVFLHGKNLTFMLCLYLPTFNCNHDEAQRGNYLFC